MLTGKTQPLAFLFYAASDRTSLFDFVATMELLPQNMPSSLLLRRLIVNEQMIAAQFRIYTADHLSF